MEMGNIPHEAVVLIVVAATALGVLLAWAMWSRFHPVEEGHRHLGADQAVYMREVRMRNLEMIEDMTRHHGPKPQRMEYV
jgi:hypothetical protein